LERISKNKEIVLCSGDDALGIGDGFILAPTLLGLADKYQVRHIANNQSYPILKKFENKNLKIYNLNEQGHFYTNDHVNAYNLVYWRIKNSLRGFGCHAINLTRKIADLPPYTDILPEISIDPRIEKQVSTFINTLKRPIIVTQPLVSFWNKMIDAKQQIDIVQNLIDKDYSVVQIGNNIPNEYIHPDAINLIGRNTIDHSMGLIKGADLFIGCDSFGAHCAASVKTPSVVLWCGTSPEDFGYDFFSNIWYPDQVNCQKKCARPLRWLYDYSYTNPDDWSTRDEVGWCCPHKSCSKAIWISDVMLAVDKELKIGRNRDWRFRDYKYSKGE
jgi:ADP-heptose:LPS heptosyltransferase